MKPKKSPKNGRTDCVPCSGGDSLWISLGDAGSSSPVAGMGPIIAEIHDGVGNDALRGEFGQR